MNKFFSKYHIRYLSEINLHEIYVLVEVPGFARVYII